MVLPQPGTSILNQADLNKTTQERQEKAKNFPVLIVFVLSYFGICVLFADKTN